MLKDEEEFMKMGIPSKVSIMLFVWEMIILRESKLLFFSSEFDFTAFSFVLESMGNDSSYVFTFRLGEPR